VAGSKILFTIKTFCMKTDKVTQQKIIRDVLISLVLYALPVILMLLSFKITGQRPWKKIAATTVNKNV
jgi:hypothetical protein